jgi:hypothetical protein
VESDHDPDPPTQYLFAILKNYATATHLHFEVTVFHTNPTSRRVEITVVVGSGTVDASKLAPQVMALAVPLSVMSILSVSPSTGVPVRLVVNDVIACARPVMCATSVTSVLIAGSAAWVMAGARFVTRLFVSVLVELIDGIVTHSTAITQALTRESVVSDAFPSSIVVTALMVVVSFPVEGLKVYFVEEA